jgi:hypothetical protein
MSGQVLYFGLMNTNSGLGITGAAANISGRRSTDAASFIVLSGPISEIGAGLYAAGLFDIDCSGNSVGYLFTASGVAATIYSTFPVVSGLPSIPQSGTNVNIYSGQLSGYSVSVSSGQNVNVFSGQLSGQEANANLIKWLGVAPNALLSSGRVDAAFNVRTGVARSGTSTTIQLDAGAPTGTSGIYDNESVTLVGGTGQGQTRSIRFYSPSGICTVFPAWATAPDGTSIFTISPYGWSASGGVNLASGSINSGVITSGVFVNATAQIGSGALSGQLVGLLSGQQTQVWSGTQVNLFSGQLSGFQVNLLSGNIIALLSGQLSGQVLAIFSGQNVLVSSGQLSGQNVNTLVNFDKSGYWLNASGLDPIQVESGLNFRQAQTTILAANAGRLSGAGTTSVQIGNASGVLRITGAVDLSGNRTGITLAPPV